MKNLDLQKEFDLNIKNKTPENAKNKIIREWIIKKIIEKIIGFIDRKNNSLSDPWNEASALLMQKIFLFLIIYSSLGKVRAV